MEKKIHAALTASGKASEAQIQAGEKERLSKMTEEEAEERMQALSQMKHLLFRQELKSKRISKIKSKLYHKIKKKGRERDEARLLEELDKVDATAADEYREKQERKRVEERARGRHEAGNRFAKVMRRFGGMEKKGAREAIGEMLR